MHNAIRRVILNALDDDEGISFGTYEAILTLGDTLPDFGTPIFDRVRATDGRFYLPEGAAQELAKQYGVDL